MNAGERGNMTRATLWARLAWLRQIAARVDELVFDPRIRDRFHRMLRDWKSHYEATRRKPDRRRPKRIVPHPVELLPVKYAGVFQKYAALAAIHDSCAEESPLAQQPKRLNPWRRVEWPLSRRTRLGIHYGILCDAVDGLTDDDRARVEAMLRAVEADIEAHLKPVQVDGGAGRMNRGPTEATQGRHNRRDEPPPEKQDDPLDNIPPFDNGSEWVKPPSKAEFDGLGAPARRACRKRGQIAADGLKGIDADGRVWRKSARNAHVFYLRSTLHSPP